jgi:hypothetical protein
VARGLGPGFPKRRRRCWTSCGAAAGLASCSRKETVRRTLALFREPRRFERVLKVAGFEPPRVRAMIGAIGEKIGEKPVALKRLRASLNPLSRFDFGMLKTLPCASRWQAKERR